MAGEVPAAAAASAATPPAPELVWSPRIMTDADIEALVVQGLLSKKAISGCRSCTGEAFPSEDRTETVVFRSFYEKGFGLPSGAFSRGLLQYHGLGATHLKPNSIAQIATFIHLCEGFLGIAPHFNLWRALYNLRLPPCTGLPPILNARWEEKPTEEEMVEVEVLLADLQKLKAEKLIGTAVALSFAKSLTQPIQERVHPGYEDSNCKVSRGEPHRRVTLIVSGEVRDKGCPKAYCLKRPTTQEKIVLFWCPAPLPEGQQGKAVDPPAGLALPAADVGSFSSDSSIGSESEDVVEVSGPAAGAGSTTKKQRATRKVAALKA
ncbi:orf3 [Panicum miliaceum]|uniref:Orf3 n=1 Tax=Panicum miliaceum TaxID=4540 RepID=A0A3L6TN53_PANMI|nr:orf3 [Panicum miliaceum]